MELNSLVKEYLKAQGLQETLETFDSEVNEKIAARTSKTLQEQLQINKVPKSNQDLAKMPLIYQRFIEEKVAEEKEPATELQQISRQHSSVLQSARQIFSIAINCLQ